MKRRKSLVKRIGIRGSVAVLLALTLVGIGVADFFSDYATIQGKVSVEQLFTMDDIPMEDIIIPFTASGFANSSGTIGNYTINCSINATGLQHINVELISTPEVDFEIEVFGADYYDQTVIDLYGGDTVYINLNWHIRANTTANDYECSMRLYPDMN